MSEFEKWAIDNSLCIDKDESGYKSYVTRVAFDAWIASQKVTLWTIKGEENVIL